MFPNYKIGPEGFKYFKMAYEHQMKGEFDQAVVHYKRSLEIEPTAEAHTFLGWTYSFMSKLEEAIEQCHMAIAIDPDFGNPYNDIGAYLLQLGRPKEAVPWLTKAKKAKRYENPEFACCNLGRAYELQGLWPKALEEYRGSVKIKSDYTPAREALLRLEPLLN